MLLCLQVSCACVSGEFLSIRLPGLRRRAFAPFTPFARVSGIRLAAAFAGLPNVFVHWCSFGLSAKLDLYHAGGML